MHRFTNIMVGKNTIFDILSEPADGFVGTIGTMIDFYAALHPEIGTSPNLAQYIAYMVREVSKFGSVSFDDAKNFMEGLQK